MTEGDGTSPPGGTETPQDDEVAEITRLLAAAGAGDRQAMDEVFSSVYPRLRRIARSRRRDWRGDPTIDTTALIHEAYLKVASRPGSRFNDRGHFFAVAAKAMRQVLINYATRKSAAKRGGGVEKRPLDEERVAASNDRVGEEAAVELLSLDAALQELESLSRRQAQVVECLFFAGLGIDETAEALEISPATVKRDWAAARAFLYRAMHPASAGSPTDRADAGTPGA